VTDIGDLRASVEAYERRLRRGSADLAAQVADPSLVALFRAIDERRSRRSSVRGSTVAVSAPRPPVQTADAPGRVISVREHGSLVRVIRIGRPPTLSFRAGQYVKLGVDGGERRKFSIASAPHDPHLDVAVELQPGGTVSPALFALAEGAAVDVADAAQGKLQLDPDAHDHLMIATVTGIAPLWSMVLDALHQGTAARFTILHGASLATEFPFYDELAALAEADERVDYVPTVSRPDDPANRMWRGATGRVDVVAQRVAPRFDPATTRVYAVGNEGMIAAVVRDLGAAGFTVSTESYG